MEPELPPASSRHPLPRLAAFAQWLAAPLFLAALLFAQNAHAAGSVKVNTPEVKESGGEWHIEVRLDLPTAPPMMHVPMRFVFSKQVVYERAIMEKGKDPVLDKKSLAVPPKQIVGMDVDFADPTGRVFKSTNFEFDITLQRLFRSR